MEVLSRILRKTKECDLTHGFHVGPVNSIGVCIFHLLFANDTILFCNASAFYKVGLVMFSSFTGLKVNVGKSEIVPIREENNLDALANILSCKVGNLPFAYEILGDATWYFI